MKESEVKPLIYLSTNMIPKNSTINPTISNIFSAVMNGSIITAYRIYIYNNDSGTLLYDSTKITLGAPLYDKSILNITLPANTITANQNCKWVLTVFDNANNSTTTGEVFFKSYGISTVSMAIPVTINSQTYTPIATYSHPQSIAIKKFKFVLYDSSNISVLKDSGYIFSANLTYVFNGFLNGSTYSIECIVVDQNDIISTTGKKTFTVSYSLPNLNIIPNASVFKDLSAIQLVWGQAIQIVGTPNGTYSYANNIIRNNNKALQLDSTSNISYSINIPLKFNAKFKILFSVGFIGVFCSLGNNDYQIGYDGTHFYFNNKGIIIYGLATTLPTIPIYVDIRPTDILVNGIRIGM